VLCQHCKRFMGLDLVLGHFFWAVQFFLNPFVFCFFFSAETFIQRYWINIADDESRRCTIFSLVGTMILFPIATSVIVFFGLQSRPFLEVQQPKLNGMETGSIMSSTHQHSLQPTHQLTHQHIDISTRQHSTHQHSHQHINIVINTSTQSSTHGGKYFLELFWRKNKLLRTKIWPEEPLFQQGFAWKIVRSRLEEKKIL
jgi:hypothetical protein